jgi:K+-sensing histidine kinase KdpD
LICIQVFIVLSLAFGMAVRSEWRLVLALVLGFAAGLIPFFLWRGNSALAPIAIVALVLILALSVMYFVEKRWIAAVSCLLSIALLIHGVFLPTSLRPAFLEFLQKFGVMVMFCVPIIAALLTKEIILQIRFRRKAERPGV